LLTSQTFRGLLSSLSAAALLMIAVSARAQTVAENEMIEVGGISAAATTNDGGPAGIIPVMKGFNASLGTTSQHYSIDGWSSFLMPNVAYRFNRYFSMDAGVPIYMYVNVDANVGTTKKPVYMYSPEKGVFGDASISFNAETSFHTIDYNANVAMGLPSGNTDYGLGAGQVTYNINNHFERALGKFTPDIELGFGDTSTLIDQRVAKSYVAVGPMMHFQAGTSLELPWSMTFEAEAYEELPLSKNIVYSTTGKGKRKVTTATNEAPAEDNGFNTSLDIPLTNHVTLSGFYTRSLRNHDDVAGFSFTFILKAPPREIVQ
jgi:hypothetical protein